MYKISIFTIAVITALNLCTLPSIAEKQLMDVTLDDKVVTQIPCERIEIFSKDTQPRYPNGNPLHRPEVNTGRTLNGDIYAAIVGTGRLYKSTDGGKTWTSMPLPPMNMTMAAFTVLHDDSFIFIRRGPQPVLHTVPAALIWQSIDYGKTWEEFSAIASAPFEGMCEGTQSFTQLKDGTVLFPTCLWKGGSDGYNAPISEGKRENVVFFSKDGGKNWRQKARTFDYVGEPHIIELQSGKLLGAFRYQRHRLPQDTNESIVKWNGQVKKDVKSIFKNVFIGESDDKGHTWKNLRPVMDKDGNALLIFGECHGQLVQVPDGRIVLVHDHRYPRGTAQIMARVSEDEGKTWGKEVYRVSLGAGYPSSVALKDGTIVTVTGNIVYNNKGRPGKFKARVVRWKLPETKTSDIKKKQRRIIVNNDGSPLTRRLLTVEELIDMVFTPFQNSHVDTIFWALGSTVDGICASDQWSHRTKIGKIFGEDIKNNKFPSESYKYRSLNLRHFFERDTDPPEIIINHAHKMGIEAFISIRMNDAHDGIKKGVDKRYVSKLKQQHPDWLLGDRAPIEMFRFSYNFLKEEVRDYRLAIIKEACEQYDLDGFELDFIRHPIFFAPEDLQKGIPVLTQFVRDVRGILDEAGKKKGRFLALAVRVPPTFKLSMNAGLDVKTWIDEGLIDILTAGIMQASLFNLPIEEFLKATRGTKVSVHPHIGISCMASRVRTRFYSDPMWRAQAALYWQVGVDGLYSFNANSITYGWCPDWDWKPFKEMGDPEVIEFMDKRYLVDHKPKTKKGYKLYVYEVMPIGILPANIKAGENFGLIIKVADDLAKAKPKGIDAEVILDVMLDSEETANSVTLNFNGSKLAARANGQWLQANPENQNVKLGENQLSITSSKNGQIKAVELIVDYQN